MLLTGQDRTGQDRTGQDRTGTFLTFPKLVLLALLFAACVAPAWAETELTGGGKTTLNVGSYVVKANVTFTNSDENSPTITLAGDVTLSLAQGKTMTVNNESETYYGISGQDPIPGGGNPSLTVCGDGELDVTSKRTAIGQVSAYTQTGGTVKLTAKKSGIGLDSQGPVSVSGGSLEATGTAGANGISSSKSITISGGRVTAKAGYNGICALDDAPVKITGGEVIAEATAETGCDIYGGGGVTITGGKVTANKKGIWSLKTITLGYSGAEDFIKVSKFGIGPFTEGGEMGSVTIAGGPAHD